MQAVVFGAGNIGRGLVGEVLHDSDYAITFVDVDDGLIELLNRDRGYVIASSSGTRTVPVERALSARDGAAVRNAVAGADVVATAVGGAALANVAAGIAAGLEVSARPAINVIACENIHPNSTALRAHVADHMTGGIPDRVAFPDVMIDRIAPGRADAVIVEVEDTFEFVVDGLAWTGDRPQPSPIVFTINLEAHKLRKLWLVNGTHALAAWLAVAAGLEFIHDAMGDAETRVHVDTASTSAGSALLTLSDEFDAESMEAYRSKTIARFENRQLPDLAVRVARNPLSKLAPDDRVVPPAVLASTLGLDVSGFAAGIAAALTMTNAEVAGIDELRSAIDAASIGPFLEQQGILPGGLLHEAILAAHRAG